MGHWCKYFVALILLQIALLLFYYVNKSTDSIRKAHIEHTIQIKELDQYSNNTKKRVTPYLKKKINKSQSTLSAILRGKWTVPTYEVYHAAMNTSVSYLGGKHRLRKRIANSSLLKLTNLKQNTNVKQNHYTNGRKTKNSYTDTFVIRNNSTTFERTDGKSLVLPNQIKSTCEFHFESDSLIKAKEKLSEQRSFYLFYVNLEGDTFKSFSTHERDNILHWQYILKEEKYLVQLPVDFDLISFDLLTIDHEETVLSIQLVYNSSYCIEHFLNATQSIRFSLWNNLFDNDTEFYLCNRHYKNEKKEHERFWLYAITTIWVGYDLACSEFSENMGIRNVELKKDELPLVSPIVCYFMSLQFVWIFVLLDIKNEALESSKTYKFYKNHDRPYGLKRFVIKMLYYNPKCPNKYKRIQNSILYNYLNHPFRRLFILVWFSILLPIGLYRTSYRYRLSQYIYKDYLDVVLPSESFLYFIYKDVVSISQETVQMLDITYAIIFPLSFLFLVRNPYETSMFHKSCLCPPNATEEALKHQTKLKARFIFPCSLICGIICCRYCKNKQNFKWNSCLPVYLILCFLPVIPFCCGRHKNCCSCLDKYEKCDWLKKGLQYVSMFFTFIFSYILCFRPIISTFTFLFRTLTYFFCVALPIRVHILQITLVFGSIIAYLSNYICEIINMNEEILCYICKIRIEEKKQHSNANFIDDKTIDYLTNKTKDNGNHTPCAVSPLVKKTNKLGGERNAEVEEKHIHTSASSVENSNKYIIKADIHEPIKSNRNVKPAFPSPSTSKDKTIQSTSEKEVYGDKSAVLPTTNSEVKTTELLEDNKKTDTKNEDSKTYEQSSTTNIEHGNNGSIKNDRKTENCSNNLVEGLEATSEDKKETSSTDITDANNTDTHSKESDLPSATSVKDNVHTDKHFGKASATKEEIKTNESIRIQAETKEKEMHLKESAEFPATSSDKKNNSLEDKKETETKKVDSKRYNPSSTTNNEQMNYGSIEFNKRTVDHESLYTEEIEYVSEEMFDYVYERLSFVKEKLYFLFFKSLFVLSYFIITVFIFILYKKSMNAPYFRDVFGIILLIIGPYAISIFLKGNKEKFLNKENESEIRAAFDSYNQESLSGDKTFRSHTTDTSSVRGESKVKKFFLNRCSVVKKTFKANEKTPLIEGIELTAM